MLLDANLLLYAVNSSALQHKRAVTWLEEHLNGPRRVGIPWQSVGAFLRVSTHPRAFAQPLSSTHAWRLVEEWLSAPAAWTPTPGARHAELFGELVTRHELTGNLIPDAQLAALALEHGLTVCSADSDFARFTTVRWENPLA